MENSEISWCHHTANFWIGCVKVSPLCTNCYADSMTRRWGKDFERDRQFVKRIWGDLHRWNEAAMKSGTRSRVFVMSMGDFFEQLPEDHPAADTMHDVRLMAMGAMMAADSLEFLVLTKRISNVRKMVPPAWLVQWPKHIRLGISVGTQKDADRDIPRLISIDCPNFLSIEPLLEKVSLGQWMGVGTGVQHIRGYPEHVAAEWSRIDWVITGGESGPHARPSHPDWFRLLRDQCQMADVPFHFKQHGEWFPLYSADQADNYPGKRLHEWEDGIRSVRVGKKEAGHLLDGVEWQQFPNSE